MQKIDDAGLKYHFIPNTHWDREWLYDYQETRMFLVEFMDKLLDIFRENPAYKTYLLDAQTIPLEDYLQIRPEKREELQQRVKEGRLFIGPWYTLPEEHLVSGESLIRNLLIGHQTAETFGAVMKVGYSPFSYGQASQMPQIYLGFGIDTILFYHGIIPKEAPAEFIFEGADGSRLLASRMGSNARYNFFFSVYRPTVFGKQALERQYSCKEQGLPFHLATSAHYHEHHILIDPQKMIDHNRLAAAMKSLREEELEHSTTEHIACMQGMDSTQPDIFEMKIMQAAAEIIDKDEIFHSSLPAYMEALKNSVEWDKLVVLKGERRTPRQLGTRKHLYSDVTSARVRIKRKNTRAELELQRQAEPLAVVSYLLGNAYPKSYLDLAWNYLLQCHPHDSIAGTGVDQIETDMHYRLDQCRTISAGLIRRALQMIQKRIKTDDLPPDHVVLTIYNPHLSPRSEILTVILDLPLESGFKNYVITDPQTNQPVEFQETMRYEHPAIVRHLGDATMEMPVLRIHLYLMAENIPALGYKTLVVKPQTSFLWPEETLVSAPQVMENAYLKIQINMNGTLDIFDKVNDQCFYGLHYFEDNGEAGHAWRHVPPARDRVISTLNDRPQIELIESGPLVSKYMVTHKMQIPARLDEGKGNYIRRLDADGDDAGRTTETRELIIKSEIKLSRQSKGIAVKTTFINQSEDHRLRVMFPTGLAATHASAEEPFDVVDRPIKRDENSPWRNTWNPTHPHQRFVDVSDGKKGLALINDGLREYEVTDNQSRTIGLTLLRAFEVALTTVAWRWERHPQMKGSQSLGFHEFNYMIYPHAGGWCEGDVMKEADHFNVELVPVQAGIHNGDLPKSKSFMELKPSDLMIAGIKKAEKGDDIILRFYNPTNKTVSGEIHLDRPVVSAAYLNLNEEKAEGEPQLIGTDKIRISAAAKKIVTLGIQFTGQTG